ncbi:MAG: hypothetical protein AUH72_19075 [Acidobacteria bacterium 13_1_40CM_4_65_8]|nr:MAG: hypothetical protein AUH72_19075 [Acidobacteria bacterium 13_1_40CM_4_65_8]
MNGAKGVDRMKTVVLVTIFTLVAAGATAQNPSAPTPSATTTVEPAERLTFDRPEAWALKYCVSSTMLSVRRNAAAQRTLDSFLNARGLLVYRIR